jgi:hypothetical protein
MFPVLEETWWEFGMNGVATQEMLYKTRFI